MTKSFTISKNQVLEAYKLVRANKGAAGIDEVTLERFEENRKDNLYQVWNRLSSGSYFPPPVKGVGIPKKNGGERILGIPTVSDRIAQMVVKQKFEPLVEKIFHKDSYGYRPNKSAKDAIGITRRRCWKYDWVLEFDIRGLFDNIEHGLLMKAVRKNTDCRWSVLYIERWLKADMIMPDGTRIKRSKGTPQGGVISPVLSNLFLHYVYDKWLEANYPNMEWCRYADDGLLHCKTLKQAEYFKDILRKRFEECGLEMHSEKTKIVYCKDADRKKAYSITEFDFLGYTFRPRWAKNKYGKLFTSFLPGVSKKAIKAMNAETRRRGFRNSTDLEIEDISRMYNRVLAGWNNYYGNYYPSAMAPVWRHFNKTLVMWALRKYKKLKGRTRAAKFIERVAQENPHIFVHWRRGKVGAFA